MLVVIGGPVGAGANFRFRRPAVFPLNEDGDGEEAGEAAERRESKDSTT